MATRLAVAPSAKRAVNDRENRLRLILQCISMQTVMTLTFYQYFVVCWCRATRGDLINYPESAQGDRRAVAEGAGLGQDPG
jgi:hypothetical protein